MLPKSAAADAAASEEENEGKTLMFSCARKTLVVILAATIVVGSLSGMAVNAITPVKGGVTKFIGGEEELPPIYGKAYYPKDRKVQRIDAIADRWALEAAEQKYKKILEKNPKNAAALNGLGKVYYWMTATSNEEIRDRKAEYYAKSTQYFLRALSYEPNYVEARLNLGTVYLEQNRFLDAQEEFTRAVRLNPKSSEANEKMGVVLLKQGQYNEACPWLRKATKLDSSNASAYYHLGVGLTSRGEYWDALRALNTSLGLFANSAPVHHQMGVVYDRQGNGAAAVAHYKQALEIIPEYQAASMALAGHYANRGDDSFALETLKNAAEADRSNTKLLMEIADMSLKNKQAEVAERYYQQVLVHDPDNRRAQKGLSNSQIAMAKDSMHDGRMMGDWKAQHAVEQALTYNPANLDAKFYQINFQQDYSKPMDFSRGQAGLVLSIPEYAPHMSFKKGEVLVDRYRFTQADAMFESAINASKSVSDSVTLGETFLAMGMPDMAERAFRHVSVQDHRHGVAQMGMKKATEAKSRANALVGDAMYRRSGLSEDRRTYSYTAKENLLLEALRLNVKNAQGHYQLAKLYEAQKRYGEAADHYFAYLQLNPAAENRQSLEKRIAKLQGRMWETSYEH